MSLSVVMHAYSLRYMVPTTIMLGTAPMYFSLWAAIRMLTICLPQRFYTSLDDRLCSFYKNLVLFFFNTITGVKVKTYGDISALFGEKENVIFLCNHQCTVDWVIANMLASNQGSLGSIRYILKDGLKYFPLYGFYLKQHSSIYVKRDKKFHQQKTEQQLAALKNSDIPVWLIIFPEGTRMNPELPEVIHKSQEYAKEQGLKELQQVLMPRSKGLQLSIEQLEGHVTAVYDITVAYSNTTHKTTGERLASPGMLEYLNGASPEIHINFERIPISDVPKDESKLKLWLYSRFQRKDRLLSHFYSKDAAQFGHFPGHSDTLHISRRATIPAFVFFGSCLTMLLLTEQGRALYWRVSLYGSVAGIVCMIVRS